MLSYMIPPVETKQTTTTTTTQNLNLVLNLNNNEIIDKSSNPVMDSIERQNSDFITSEKKQSSVIECDLDEKINLVNEKLQHQMVTDTTTTTSSVIVATSAAADKSKLTKLNLKNAPLKRVSFGSNKEGSMVETVIFETPTPLPETAEKQFFSSDYTNGNSFNELQEELERSKVRVTFFQSIKPQQISPPADFEFHCFSNPLLDNLFISPADIGNNNMTAALMPDYQRNLSIDDGTENPFRPDGELSKEADEIVNLIKGGNLTTPISENHPQIIDEKDGAVIVKEATKLDASSPKKNGSKNHQNENSNGEAIAETNQVANQTVPGPQSATSVVIEEKKKKKSKCCVIQ